MGKSTLLHHLSCGAESGRITLSQARAGGGIATAVRMVTPKELAGSIKGNMEQTLLKNQQQCLTDMAPLVSCAFEACCSYGIMVLHRRKLPAGFFIEETRQKKLSLMFFLSENVGQEGAGQTVGRLRFLTCRRTLWKALSEAPLTLCNVLQRGCPSNALNCRLRIDHSCFFSFLAAKL